MNKKQYTLIKSQIEEIRNQKDLDKARKLFFSFISNIDIEKGTKDKNNLQLLDLVKYIFNFYPHVVELSEKKIYKQEENIKFIIQSFQKERLSQNLLLHCVKHTNFNISFFETLDDNFLKENIVDLPLVLEAILNIRIKEQEGYNSGQNTKEEISIISYLVERVSKDSNFYLKNKMGLLDYLISNNLLSDRYDLSIDWNNITATSLILPLLSRNNKNDISDLNAYPFDMKDYKHFRTKRGTVTINDFCFEKIIDLIKKRPKIWFCEEKKINITEVQFLHDKNLLSNVFESLNIEKDWYNINLLESYIIFSNNDKDCIELLEKDFNKNKEKILQEMMYIFGVAKNNKHVNISNLSMFQVYDLMPETTLKFDKACMLFCLINQFNSYEECGNKEILLENIIMKNNTKNISKKQRRAVL